MADTCLVHPLYALNVLGRIRPMEFPRIPTTLRLPRAQSTTRQLNALRRISVHLCRDRRVSLRMGMDRARLGMPLPREEVRRRVA